MKRIERAMFVTMMLCAAGVRDVKMSIARLRERVRKANEIYDGFDRIQRGDFAS